MPDPLLAFTGVHAGYGGLAVLRGVDYAIAPGEIVALLGGNATGKTTSMKLAMGLLRPTAGRIAFAGTDITRAGPASPARDGMAIVPEARRLFPRMTVAENLRMGAFRRRDRGGLAADLDRVHALFPRVLERATQIAGTMSGGEQQMVAIARALMARPRLILMDEPSMGLSPLFVEQVFATVREINAQGVAIFMVEQNANMALSVAHRGYVLQDGQALLAGPAAALRADPRVQQAYLGG